jgi:hypothetical protein
MFLMPPGSAKSTYCSVVLPTWCMGRRPGCRIILASYGSDLARNHGRRARQIVRSPAYRLIFGTTLSGEASAADAWSLANGSEFMAGGILSGMTGHRADGIVIDDPVKGRDEAESETIRRRTRAAYEDDIKTRLKPGGWTILIQTRWHADDLAGSILPAGWNGESGLIRCRDGFDWDVLCLPAKCERADDPLGRRIGDYLWPEWFDAKHWAQFERNPRTWSALYQQRPAPQEGAFFRADWLRAYDTLPARATLRVYGASDYAVTADGGDYTVHVVVAVDPQGRMYVADLWRAQSSSDVWVETLCDLIVKWRPLEWAEETGQIKAGVGPFLTRSMRDRAAFVARRQFPARGDKGGARAIDPRPHGDGRALPAGRRAVGRGIPARAADVSGRRARRPGRRDRPHRTTARPRAAGRAGEGGDAAAGASRRAGGAGRAGDDEHERAGDRGGEDEEAGAGVVVEMGGIPPKSPKRSKSPRPQSRPHLGRPYEKTGARRHADFVKLVAGFSRPLIG